MNAPIRIIVVDDHPLFRAGVTQSLALDPTITVIAEGNSGSQALELVERHEPDVILLDISMPGNGIDAAAAITATQRPPRVLMLTGSDDGHDVMRAIEAGASGYVLKGISANDLIAAVKSVAAGETFVTPSLSLGLLTRLSGKAETAPLARLTLRELRVLELLAQGLSNRGIGGNLGVHEKTVKFHVTNILRKLKVRNRVEAALALKER
ncbi:response regulator [Shinella zoogloeoides]|uniref:response regulator n=1 Tax=Shinella zoogloeoides TaxID=352475 RepID=UPI0013C2DB21|nr:response regulator transcription factor [Shinella zoogloeoides]WPE22761.1 Transcriptional regulatory protein DegU [Shinella zoogloeoides]